MTDIDFVPFPSIKHIGKLFMRITQKIHGSNAQIHIMPDGIRAGSRNRWLTVDDDNFGFAKWVADNAEQLKNLGVGTHYGEWAGPGINNGEGLTERTLFLFSNPERYLGADLPKNVTVVPELYKGPCDSAKIEECMARLLANGSYAVPGFMTPEGVVIEIAGNRYKKVFELEDSKWTGVKKERKPHVFVDYPYLCQPLRLEKLLSRDEAYLRDYPESLPAIAKDYIADLIKEGQIVGTDDEINAIRKGASRDIFVFIKTVLKGK